MKSGRAYLKIYIMHDLVEIDNLIHGMEDLAIVMPIVDNFKNIVFMEEIVKL